MKIIKTLAVAGVATILVAGSAFAWNGSNENCDVENPKISMEQMRSKVANGSFSKIASYKSGTMNVFEIISEVTGKSADEVKELCTDLREEGKALVDYLKDENLLDEVKSAIIDKSEEQLNKLVEDGRISQDELTEKLEAITLKINDEEFKLFGSVFGKKMAYVSPINNDVLELTGLDKDEFRNLCTELREDGKTIVDYLKDNGLYDEWKSNILEKFEDKMSSAIENNRITAEKAAELKDQLVQKIEDGKMFNLGDKVKSLRDKMQGNVRINPNASMLELTGLSAEEFKDLCEDLREEGKTIVDYLKDEGLFDEWKQDMLEKYEDRLDAAVESGKLTEEKATELLTQYEEKIEDGFNFGLSHRGSFSKKAGHYSTQQRGNKTK
jgi:polyhydroxyalkanoate synthesis regulator phasin